MDDEIEIMCSCHWIVSFTPAPLGQIVGTATHHKYGMVQSTRSNARKITENLFLLAQGLDSQLRALAAL